MFVYAGVKTDSAYYHNVLLSQQLLPVIHQISGKFFIFQQHSAPAPGHVTPSVSWNVTHLHSSRQICGRRIAQTLIESTTRSGVLCSTEFTRQRSRIWTIWSAVWLTCGLVYSTALSTTPSTSGINVSERGGSFKHLLWLSHQSDFANFNSQHWHFVLTVCLLQNLPITRVGCLVFLTHGVNFQGSDSDFFFLQVQRLLQISLNSPTNFKVILSPKKQPHPPDAGILRHH